MTHRIRQIRRERNHAGIDCEFVFSSRAEPNAVSRMGHWQGDSCATAAPCNAVDRANGKSLAESSFQTLTCDSDFSAVEDGDGRLSSQYLASPKARTSRSPNQVQHPCGDHPLCRPNAAYSRRPCRISHTRLTIPMIWSLSKLTEGLFQLDKAILVKGRP
jgi:hypothetical protein